VLPLVNSLCLEPISLRIHTPSRPFTSPVISKVDGTASEGKLPWIPRSIP